MSEEGAEMKDRKINKDIWAAIGKYGTFSFGLILGVIVIFFVIKFLLFYWVYTFFAGLITSWFGLDSRFSSILAVSLTIAAILAIPAILSFVFLGGRKKEVLAVVGGLLIVLSVSFYFSSDQVLFDRATGKASKYYIKTLDGFKFSSTEDYDPALGTKFKPVTSEIAKEYFLWKKTGKIQTPKVIPGNYFDRVTGEAICWYVERTDGKIVLFSLPGYDPVTGTLLQPITKEIVDKYRLFNSINIPTNDSANAPELGIEKKIESAVNSFSWTLNGKDLYQSILSFYLQEKSGYNFKCISVEIFSADDVSMKTFWHGRPVCLVTVEKVVLLSRFTIVGVSISSNKTANFYRTGRFFDANGSSLEALDCLGSFVNIEPSEKRRILYIFKKMPLDSIKKGTFVVNDVSVEFQLDETQEAMPQ